MSEDRRLNTADDPKRPDEVRGHREESATNRTTVIDRPERAPAAPVQERQREPAPRSDAGVNAPESESPAALFTEHDAADLKKRWGDIQAGFVDAPRRAVEQADSLVADVTKRLAEGFANERGSLEHQWDRGDNVTTEDLRMVLRRYRSFFDRLLSV